jgi:hypothetical protein
MIIQAVYNILVSLFSIVVFFAVWTDTTDDDIRQMSLMMFIVHVLLIITNILTACL